MRRCGRITVYGEYLMSSDVRGLIIPTPLYLATHDDAARPLHPEYDPSRDTVARTLLQRGVSVETTIRGDLPFGCGFASSTVLAFLHAGNQLPLRELLMFIQESDRAIHGFVPSGVDAAAVFHQSTGLYSARGWEPVPLSPLRYTLLLFPNERASTLAHVQERISDNPSKLIRIAGELTSKVTGRGELDYPLMIEYGLALLGLGVYSSMVDAFVHEMLSRGIVAKGIGGLYDKAVIVLWPEDTTMRLTGQKAIDSFAPLRVLHSSD